ncbi:serine/threonine-protein kinase [Actinophytocola sp. NPDC049390]|uniref:serine/threonine-protein kinase n=1 Tax=Actinophytocola sp. NPDC049390 TaxID=3363894 RepID=UPI0037A20C2E
MDTSWRPERVVARRYRLVAPAGEDATVWRAVDLRLGHVVAVKRVRVPTGDEAPLARRRAVRAASAVARLRHPNVVAVHDIAIDDSGDPVLVMEYVPARTLADVLADRGVLPAARVARVGRQVAAALAAAHAAGIVHRDVTPANILLAGDGTATITGFGPAGSGDDMTGAPAYLAPETARGEPPTPAADVFSLGATLYTALEGNPPAGTADRPVAARGALAEPLMAMLHDDPAARPTMGQIADTLTGAGSPPSRRNIALVVVATLVSGLLTLLLLTTWPVGRADRDGSAEPTATSSPPADPDRFRRAVTSFYAVVTDDPDRAWSLLGPALRDQGRDRFEARWRDVADLRVRGTPTVSGNTVVAEIEYTAGGRVRETHRHTLVTDGGTVLIDSDEVLATTTLPGGT